MTDIWSGDIVLPDGTTIQDVGLASPNVASSPALACTGTTLRFLATVETAKMPLYLAAGPSLDVWTSCEATEAWFESILLSKPAGLQHEGAACAGQSWWAMARSQSPIGILVQVQNAVGEGQKPGVTEILFYGTIAPTATGALPTPPSSSPEHFDALQDQLPELRVHALPLSSDLLYRQPTLDALPASPTLSTINVPSNIDAQFLPPQLDAPSVPDSPKRKRDLFEEATIANKKARGKGGAAIAAAAARADSRPPSANGALSRPASRQLSRAPSITSDTRPISRKGTDGNNKRSTLSQVATIPLQSEEPTTESRNREALSRVVMAAMRMHGLQQRKKTRSRRASVAPGVGESQDCNEEVEAEEAAKDEEFKLIYHQTYKGAAFALRKHILEKPLHVQPDQLRDVVEKLLSIFLSDPLAELLAAEPKDLVATPGAKSLLGVPGSTNGHASPFDLPSAARPGLMRAKTDGLVFTGSPVSRRAVRDAAIPA